MPTRARTTQRRASSARSASKPEAAKTRSKARSAKRELPAALARRADALSARKRTRLLAEAAGLIALVQRRKREISEAFYDLGVALKRLKEKEILLVLGCRSFDQLCSEKLDLSTTLGNRLVEVVSSMTRDDAIGMGQTKAMAFVALAAASCRVLSTGAPQLPTERL
jgi:hypothetical protein